MISWFWSKDFCFKVCSKSIRTNIYLYSNYLAKRYRIKLYPDRWNICCKKFLSTEWNMVIHFLIFLSEDCFTKEITKYLTFLKKQTLKISCCQMPSKKFLILKLRNLFPISIYLSQVSRPIFQYFIKKNFCGKETIFHRQSQW